MPDDADPPQYDRQKIRIGLGMVALVVLVSVVMFFVVDAAVGKALMFAIALTAFVRGFLLTRALRATPSGGSRPPT